MTAALFAGAAFYVNFAEQPARLAFNQRASLIQWQRSYERVTLMQASLALLGFALGLAAWWWEGRDPRWLAGAIILLAPWPYTLLVIKPVNAQLKAADPLGAGPQTRARIERWGLLHAGRTALGILATATFPAQRCAKFSRPKQDHLTLRSHAQRGVSKGGHPHVPWPMLRDGRCAASSAGGFIHAQPQGPLVWRLRTIWPRLCRPSRGGK